MLEPTDREIRLASELEAANARIAELTRHDPVYRAAVRHFGRDVILDDARKEVLTLRWSIRQMMGNAVYEPDVQDSIADVEIACAMLRVIVGDSAVDAAKAQKLDRLVRRMGGGE